MIELHQPADSPTRRAALGRAVAGVVAAAALVGAVEARGAEPGGEGLITGSVSEQAGNNPRLVRAAAVCIERGEACLAHCINELAVGESALAECARAVSAMLSTSRALASLAAMDAKRLKVFAIVAIDFFHDCEAACRDHSSSHAECRLCLEACRATSAELERFVV